jgi:hypothetical protein
MRVLASCLLLLLLLPSWSGWTRLPELRPGAKITLSPVPLVAGDPSRRRLGALAYLGGVELRSADPAFGGYSAMIADGDRLTLLSDGGELLRLELSRDLHLRAALAGRLPQGPGTGWTKEDRDTESLTRDAAGRLWVGYEVHNAIWRYAPGFAAVQAHAQPPAMAHWHKAGGPEAMTRLIDGRFLVISETTPWRGPSGRAALLFDGDPTMPGAQPVRFGYRPQPGYDVSDAASLPDGRVLVLNRRFVPPYGWSAALDLFDPAAIAPGRLVGGKLLARFDGATTHDNYEALGVTREGRDTILWLASDDNQSWLQRSLLLKFRLDLPPR